MFNIVFQFVFFFCLGLLEERHLPHGSKQLTISTDLSTLSFEMKKRPSYSHSYENAFKYHNSNKIKSNHARLTILLLSVSISFLILTLPAVVSNLFQVITFDKNSSNSNNNYLNLLKSNKMNVSSDPYYTFARILMLMNHSINFILYLTFGKRFRHDLKRLFINCCRK